MTKQQWTLGKGSGGSVPKKRRVLQDGEGLVPGLWCSASMFWRSPNNTLHRKPEHLSPGCLTPVSGATFHGGNSSIIAHDFFYAAAGRALVWEIK
jgi:hypothetical protein